MIWTIVALGLNAFAVGAPVSVEEETLAPLEKRVAPASFEELWSGYDPRKEPLDVEVLKSGRRMGW